ncbi:MAG: Na+/H+ antiporter NhaA [Bacteroidales bacterium]
MEFLDFSRLRRTVKARQETQALATPFAKFMGSHSIGGILLLIFTLIAILCNNIPFLSGFGAFWETDLTISFGFNADFLPLRTVRDWVNDGVMVFFFFLVGLEIKREMVVGDLSSIRNALLPIFAAIGGMIVPALMYAAFNYGEPGQHGWGIPMATDIAFTIGILSLFGKRVPIALKVFLTALAIVDDLGAIIVMAIFYPSHALHYEFLLAAAAALSVLILFNRLRVNAPFPYVAVGILLWFFVLRSGVHATIAGVILAMVIPSSIKINQIRFYVRSKYMLDRFKNAYSTSTPLLKNTNEQRQINNLSKEINNVTPLLLRLEHSLEPWIKYCIMPLFALANAGVIIDTAAFFALTEPLSLGIFFGLFVGKPIGIILLSFIAIKLRVAKMPENTRWIEMMGAAQLAGIGFTMSIFIDSIAFSNNLQLQNTGKLAILITSIIAGVAGSICMYYASRSSKVTD